MSAQHALSQGEGQGDGDGDGELPEQPNNIHTPTTGAGSRVQLQLDDIVRWIHNDLEMVDGKRVQVSNRMRVAALYSQLDFASRSWFDQRYGLLGPPETGAPRRPLPDFYEILGALQHHQSHRSASSDRSNTSPSRRQSAARGPDHRPASSATLPVRLAPAAVVAVAAAASGSNAVVVESSDIGAAAAISKPSDTFSLWQAHVSRTLELLDKHHSRTAANEIEFFDALIGRLDLDTSLTDADRHAALQMVWISHCQLVARTAERCPLQLHSNPFPRYYRDACAFLRRNRQRRSQSPPLSAERNRHAPEPSRRDRPTSPIQIHLQRQDLHPRSASVSPDESAQDSPSVHRLSASAQASSSSTESQVATDRDAAPTPHPATRRSSISSAQETPADERAGAHDAVAGSDDSSPADDFGFEHVDASEFEVEVMRRVDARASPAAFAQAVPSDEREPGLDDTGCLSDASSAPEPPALQIEADASQAAHSDSANDAPAADDESVDFDDLFNRRPRRSAHHRTDARSDVDVHAQADGAPWLDQPTDGPHTDGEDDTPGFDQAMDEDSADGSEMGDDDEDSGDGGEPSTQTRTSGSGKHKAKAKPRGSLKYKRKLWVTRQTRQASGTFGKLRHPYAPDHPPDPASPTH